MQSYLHIFYTRTDVYTYIYIFSMNVGSNTTVIYFNRVIRAHAQCSYPGMCNTNVDGRQKVMFALTAIRGMGRRISNIVS